MFELLASLVARSLVVAEEHGPETRYRLLETIRQYGEERLDAGRARPSGGGPATPATTRTSSDRSATTTTTGTEVFWAVRLSAEQDNLLAAWSWAIGTGNVDTAFAILAGFAPVRGLEQLPAAAGRRSGPGAARRD